MTTLTDNDVAFIAQLQKTSKHNLENDNKKSIVTSRALLSKDLQTIFNVPKNGQGAWFMNVYVEFEPMFRELKAEDWQQ